MTPDPAFWRGRRVFLTGHTGFKGSWLSLWLQRMGAVLTGYALPPATRPALFDAANAGAGMTSVIGDVRDAAALSAAMRRARPEVVLHLAAQPLVRASYARPADTFATNVMGTAHLLDAARDEADLRAIVVVTTDKCYENREWDWGYRESDPLGGHDPYSASKACTELATAAWRSSFFGEGGHPAGVATARAGNVIGGGDWAGDRLVADLVRAIDAGRPAMIRNPGAVRPWQHVLEPLSGYLLLAQRLHAGDTAAATAWNFGPSDEDARTVGWLADRLTARWGDGAGWHDASGGNGPHEAGLLRLDSSRARRHLGWRPRWRLAQAIERIVDWHRAHRAGAPMRDVTLAQIADWSATPVPD